jgi:putative tricarboxylic transport membrane protein
LRETDRRVGAALALLAAAVLWSSRAFPAVPGQKVGAGFLPAIVGAGLLVCGLLLMARRGGPGGAEPTAPPGGERFGAPLAVVAAVLAYILGADRLGFLVIAPPLLAGLFLVLRVRPLAAVGWAVAGTLVVHVGFYKLLRVPLPWGLLRPFY